MFFRIITLLFLLPLCGEAGAFQCPPMSKDNVPRVDAEGLRLLDKCIASQPETKQIPQNVDPKTGQYTRMRIELHNKIIVNMLAGKTCVKNHTPIAIFMGGLPGSGKSTFKKQFIKPAVLQNSVNIDADAIRSNLPEYMGWNASNTQKETKDIINDALKRVGSSCKYNFIYDSTFSNVKKGKHLINDLLHNGYKVYLFEVSIPESMSAKRVLNRYQTGTGEDKLRYVPIRVIKEDVEGIKETYNSLKNMFTGYALYDAVSATFITKHNVDLVLQ